MKNDRSFDPSPARLSTFLLEAAAIVLPDRVIRDGALLIDQGKISRIWEGPLPPETSADLPVIQAPGRWILPGIIDLHTDALEIEVCPRPGADFAVDVALRELERKMCGVGYTRVYHSLYLGYKPATGGLSLSREDFFKQAYAASQRPSLIRNHLHLRFEITGIDAYDTCLSLVESGMIDLLSIMDHTPGQGQYRAESFIRREMGGGKTEAEARARLATLMAQPKVNESQLEVLFEAAHRQGVKLASHDDDRPEKVAWMYERGGHICEFPINLETAAFARSQQMITIGGAANVLRGGSLTGNLHVAEAVAAGHINCLCSDYYPPAMLHAVFKLHHEYQLPLPAAMQLVSLIPAQAMDIDDHTGSIDEGKSADLIIVDWVNAMPVVNCTIVEGQVVSTQYMRPSLVEAPSL